MAMGAVFRKMKEDATCSICLELMTKPVSIKCGHSYCQSCIMQNLEIQPVGLFGFYFCPVCRSDFHKESIRPVKELENIINSIKKVEEESLCKEHEELLQLYCKDDEQFICLRCIWTPQHKGHSTAFVEDICKSYKSKFQESVTKLKRLENECNSWKLDTSEQTIKFQENIELRKQEIKSDFKKLHVILYEEEQVCLWKLEKQKELTLKKLWDKESSLEKQSQELKKHILKLENKCQGSAQNLLQDAAKTLHESSSVKLEVPETISLELCNPPEVSKTYVYMKTILAPCYVSVTLDPDTAHRELILTENQRRVTRGCPEKKLKTRRRFTVSPCVLGCETFTSGRHYFEVNVQKSTDWDVGVCLENVPRDVDVDRNPESGFWGISRCKVNGYIALSLPFTAINSEKMIWHVGVFLDFETRHVSFYDMSTNTRILTFQNAVFSEPVKPYFRVGKGSICCIPLDK